MLTFEEKKAIIESFPEIVRKEVSMGRLNYHYGKSSSDKKVVVYHLHPNGNGFVFAKHLQGVSTDSKGFVNIRDYSADDLRAIIQQSIKSLEPKPTDEISIIGDLEEETWIDKNRHTLLLKKEDGAWNVYAGLNFDGTFNSYREASSYLEEEGFRRK
jgi:hypothetical protein